VKKSSQRSPVPPVSFEARVAQATEALRLERFREAVELLKPVVRQEPRPEWRHLLAEAYRGRARALAAKRMFKEAAIVLENTLAANGTLCDPLLYVQCLIRDGQQQKAAAHALLYVGRQSALPNDEGVALEDLTAALLLTASPRPDPARPSSPERTRWLELAAASRDALEAWTKGARPEEVERHLSRISLRSAFRPVRLLVKVLLDGPHEAERSRQLLQTIGQQSAFVGLREAVEAAVGGDVDPAVWHRLTPAQQTFVAEMRGLPASASRFLTGSAEAARGGAAPLFAFLLRQADLTPAEIRSACLNLLPQLTDRLPQFEKAFGPLSALERHRIHALAAEARGEWRKAESFWNRAAEAISDSDPQAGLTRGVILRHLADLAERHPQIEGDPADPYGDPATTYLERSCHADPDHVPAVLALMARYRSEERDKDWQQLAAEAAQRFPDNRAALQQATEAAVARKAFRKAAGFARRLLAIDPINLAVRRQMIRLQIAHARKQMRARRPDLAIKELAAAAEWERPEAPDALLRIAQGLARMQGGEGQPAEARLREGVALAGGGVPGWFRAALEAELMRVDGTHAGRLRKALAEAREAPPSREDIMAVIKELGQPEAGEQAKVVASLLLGLRAWLERGAGFDWMPDEFQALADSFARFAAYDLLETYARAARRRSPATATARFYQIVARSRGDAARLSAAEAGELMTLAQAAAAREDFHAAKRIDRFLDGEHPAGPGRRRQRRRRELADAFETETLDMLIETMMNDMPRGAADGLRAMVRELGREAAVAVLAEQFRHAALGPAMPEPLLRELCEAVVARTVAGAGPALPRRGPQRQGQA
jgi:tetratricopeptide (TPR) repeat protein